MLDPYSLRPSRRAGCIEHVGEIAGVEKKEWPIAGRLLVPLDIADRRGELLATDGWEIDGSRISSRTLYPASPRPSDISHPSYPHDRRSHLQLLRRARPGEH